MRGRKTKPNAINILEGNPGHRALPEQPNVFPGAPEPGESVKADPVAMAEWNRLIPELVRIGLIAEIDAASLASYCLLISLAHKASDSIRADGVLVVTSGGVKKNPACGLLFDAVRGIKALAVEFGLTPSSRSRVSHATPVDAQQTAFENFLFDPDDGADDSPLPRMGLPYKTQ